MTVDYYNALPAALRGSALESHTGWPRTWTAPDHETAVDVLVTLIAVMKAGGVNHLYAKWITADNHNPDVAIVHVDRTVAA